MTSASSSAREVLMVGGLPFDNLEDVYRSLSEHLGTTIKRMPDGERMGWLAKVWRSHAQNPSLREDGHAHLNGQRPIAAPAFCLCEDAAADNLILGPYGYAENARRSYATFKRLKEEGVIPPDVRFQATLAGPGTTVYSVKVEPDRLLPRAAQALVNEIQEIVRDIPANELAIQLDVAMEAEHEEYVRAPDTFDTPVHEKFHWTQAQMADAVANVANSIPAEVELGFHICTIWHHDPAGGQDNTVVVETINALVDRIKRPITYFHIPVIPEHDRIEDYEPLRGLRLGKETKLFLGLINLVDGIAGAEHRIRLAEQIVPDFGVSFYCGLGAPDIMSAVKMADPSEDRLRRRVPLKERPPRPEPDVAISRPTVPEVPATLELFRQVAELPSRQAG